MKIVKDMSAGKMVRQGDVFLVKIGEADSEINPDKIIEDGILARGEATGHIHTVATMEMRLSEDDMRFLESVQKRLSNPTVFKDNDTVIVRRQGPNGITLVQNRVAKILARAPFILTHIEQSVRVIPSDEEALARDLHYAQLVPAGLYMVIAQGEHDEREGMRRVVD